MNYKMHRIAAERRRRQEGLVRGHTLTYICNYNIAIAYINNLITQEIPIYNVNVVLQK